MDACNSRSERLLIIYSQLVNGAILSKKSLSTHFGVAPRSIQRDMEALRNFCITQGLNQTIVYDKAKGGYCLKSLNCSMLNDNELYAVCRILLASRSMPKSEMFGLIDKLVNHCSSQISRASMTQLIEFEKFCYQEPHHHRNILSNLWDLAQAVRSNHRIELMYDRVCPSQLVKRVVEPVFLLFSQYYFFIVVFLNQEDWELFFPNEKDIFPMVYQVDRIRSYRTLPETFQPHLKSTSEALALRQRFQFMISGELRRIHFLYSGPFLEHILDRLPTARILRKNKSGVEIEAEVFGIGAEKWLLSQSPMVQDFHSEILPYQTQFH